MADERLSAACLWNQHLLSQMKMDARSERRGMYKMNKARLGTLQENVLFLKSPVNVVPTHHLLKDAVACCLRR